jgi:hypothetical protein
MLTISEILSLQPKPEDWDRKPPSQEEITRAVKRPRKQRSHAYEDEVFTFLFKRKNSLGIERIYRFKNQLIDGTLELPNSDLVAMEIKLRMNWMKACQSGFQFRHFLTMSGTNKSRIKAGIVFFEEFSGGWEDKRWPSRPIQLGWVAWYREHNRANDLPLHSVRFAQGELETYSEPIQGGGQGMHRPGHSPA